MRTWPNGARGALLLASGLLLGSLATAGASDLGATRAQIMPKTAEHERHLTTGSTSMSAHQTGGGATGTGAMQGMNGGARSMDPAAHYIEWMIPHHEDAVLMADLAPAQAEHAEIRALAAHIRQVQTEEIALMRGWYQAWYGGDVPAGAMMGGGMHMGMDDMASLDGARPFDKVFIEQMIPHHEMAVMGSTMALRMIERPELRELLQSIITSQRAEITQMRDWYQQWYGVPAPASSMGGSAIMGGMGGHGMMGMSGHGAMGGMSGHGVMGGQAGRQMDGQPMQRDSTATDRQPMIHQRGSSVMPFNLSQTTHRFQIVAEGGLQTVTAHDPTNQTQIALIQRHLSELAARFQRGDFTGPAALHGSDMPGLAQLSAAGPRLQIVYAATPDGAQVRYTTQDPDILAALREWFAAQLADHGADATDH